GTVGSPMVNLTKQKTDGKISILFKHALAKVAIDIKEVVDALAPTTSVNPTSDGTKVVVKSLKLKGTAIGTQGDLNLYTGAWDVTTSGTEFTVAPLPASITVDAAPTSYPAIAGVDEDGLDKTIDLMLIPAVTPAATTITGVEIVYYVCTEDSQLDGEVSVVEDKISKDFDSALTIVKGKQYNLNVLLGLTSIDLTATVENWTVESTTNVDLPKNK
ncbi:MAG: fimbrillin family protein, partial [Bacteroidales bacterium]|nr:fimbrillin family protein [Bacteroidales bacterium]